MRSIKMNFHCLKISKSFNIAEPIKFTTVKILTPVQISNPETKKETEKKKKKDKDDLSESEYPFVVD